MAKISLASRLGAALSRHTQSQCNSAAGFALFNYGLCCSVLIKALGPG
jgi:hypothetical protein